MRVLVTGAGGQLGREVVFAASEAGWDAEGATRADLDVTDPDAVLAAVTRIRPDVIVHAAAWTAVDACEADPERAHRCNATATRHVVSAARAVDARVVYVSTDYVFDGTSPRPYVESDQPAPRSVYGASKLAGEREVDQRRDLVVRVSWLCGFHGANMVKTILRLADQPGTLAFVDDQRGNPTFADDASRMILHLAARGDAGIWHVTNQGSVSWYEFAREVMRAAGEDSSRVRPIATRDLVPPRPAERPANSVLDNARLRDAGVPLLDDFRIPLERLVRRLRGA